ncbi:MAG: hypothetical protein AB2A00_38275 [Myxococcota bacterium]
MVTVDVDRRIHLTTSVGVIACSARTSPPGGTERRTVTETTQEDHGMARMIGRANPSRSTPVLLLALLSLVVAGRARAATYPSPPPDFSHPDTPHRGDIRLSPVGGQEDRPLLVIYARWDDVGYPAEFPVATVAERFFGTGFPSTSFPSVGDYFRRLSFNDLFLFPAAETQGTAYDGVVQVTVPGTKTEFFSLPATTRNRILLELADPFVDYASFDGDGNGVLTNLELVVNALEAEPTIPLPQGCGITRGVDSVSLDETSLGGLSVAMSNTATNLITIIHETAHVALGMIDFYGFDVGSLDIGAATCGAADNTYFAPSAWNKLHWGWITPTVVTQDGYYDVRRADTTGDAFILYDPDRGTSDYFLLENRRMTPGTYDQGSNANGLVIWRIDDDALGVDPDVDPIGLMRPAAGFQAWDAANAAAPQRTMSQPWADGTASQVAVRAIGVAGETVRAYLDVRGPGVLVDTYPVDVGGPVRLTAAGENIVDVPVMNTGEACDTFVFEAIDLPTGWTMSPGARILCAGETSFARMTVTPDANAVVGTRTIFIRGRSLTNDAVTTVAPLSVEVVLRSTRLGLAGLLAVSPTGTATTFQVRLSAEDDPEDPGLAGIPVTFTLTGSGGTLTEEATTDANGVATVTPSITLPPGDYVLTIETPRVGEFAPSLSSVPYAILSTADAILSVADDIQQLLTGETAPDILSALQAARDDLVGNHHGGPSTNGALTKLDDGDPVGAITKLQAAIGNLLTAEAEGAGDLSSLVDLLGLTAAAIATTEYEAAESALSTPSPGEARALARIADEIDAGHSLLRAGRQLDACDNFRRATARAIDLVE